MRSIGPRTLTRLALALLAIGLAVCAPGLGAQSSAQSGTPPPPFPDQGTFRFYLNEEVLVTAQFTWDAQGLYQGEYVLTMAGQSVTTKIALPLTADGGWSRIDMETAQGPVSVVRTDSLASVTHAEKTSTLQLKPATVLFENFSPALMALALRRYDQTAGGKQTLSIFIVPMVVMDGSLERLDTVERMIGGEDVPLTRYRYGLPGVDITVYADTQGRIVFGDVPSQHGAYVREGYETLLRPPEADALLSQPVYEIVVDSNVAVPMRDGLALATDIYRPREAGRYPVVLVRTPYKKEMQELQGRFFARRGYVYAAQDCRGRFASPGVWDPFFNEPQDGYDAIEWLAVQPWANGRVGMIGASYLGWVQWWAARDRPPHLTTIIPNVSPPDPHYNIPYEYGVFFLTGAIWWADVLESNATGDLSGKAMSEVNKKEYSKLLRHLPVVGIDEHVLGKKNPYWREWIAHPDNDAYWERANFLDRLGELSIPVFHQSGWFDGDGIGSKLNYLRMAASGHPQQKLVLGPWGHSDVATRMIGERDFGEAATIDLQRDYLRWLDRWLRDVRNGIDEEPLVSLFVMGRNAWLQGPTYPLPETRMTRLYLDSGGNANTSNGDGRLAWSKPAADAPPDRFVYDPGDPTPSPRFFEDEDGPGGDAPATESVDEARLRAKAHYGLIDSLRTDILVYETPPLTEPLTIAGPISAVLYASSSAKDTDWFVRLSEVTEQGEIFWLVEGKVRARYRESTHAQRLLQPGAVYRYDLDLWQTGIEVPAGRALRVEVASCSFPLFSRNLNTGAHNETTRRHVKARQTIYHDAARPSYVLLPVIPK
jgi:hypothetical protein